MNEEIRNLSLEAVGYQVKILLKELLEYTPDDYPDEACYIGCWFYCIAKHIDKEIWALRTSNRLSLSEETRIRDLAEIIRQIFFYTRPLKTSNPAETPPEIYLSIQELVQIIFPDDKNPIVLIGPQWDYNLTYNPLSKILYSLFSFSKLDPQMKLRQDNLKDLIRKIWNDHKKDYINNLHEHDLKLKRLKISGEADDPPHQVAILTFAGLDRDDALMYPLLAHEIGHFVDFSESPPISEAVFNNVTISYEEVDAHFGDDHPPERKERYWQDINKIVLTGLLETFADLIAVRLMGISFFFAMAEMLNSTTQWSDSVLTASGYPGMAFRLKTIFDQVLKIENGNDLKAKLESEKDVEYSQWLLEYIKDVEDKLKESQSKWDKEEYFDSDIKSQYSDDREIELLKLGVQAFLIGKQELEKAASIRIDINKKAKIGDSLYKRVDLLKNDLPPFLEEECENEFYEIMSAAWVYQRKFGDLKESEMDPDDAHTEYQNTCRLVFKAVELIQVKKVKSVNGKKLFKLGLSEQTNPAPNKEINNSKGVLNDSHIIGRLEKEVGNEKRISVVPKISKNKGSATVGEASLDIHLGNWFAFAKKSKISEVDLSDKKARKLFEQKGRNQFYVPLDGSFIIHPGDFVLGTTLEFFGLPNDLMAFVEGKSSIGRLGLFIATATQVGPVFKGVIVLELANAGTVPLSLKPGMPIAQLVFQTLTDKAEYKGAYSFQTKPIQ